MGILFGLLTALSWGVSDYVATLATRRTGVVTALVSFHVVSTVVLGVAVAASGALDGVTARQLGVLAAFSLVGWAFYLSFYKALSIGPISIVSPIVSGYGAVTVVLAVVGLGESLNAGQTAAVGVSVAGVLLASSDLGQIRQIERQQRLGLLLALVATVAGGGFVLGISLYSEDLGWLGPIFLGRLFVTGLLLASSARHVNLRELRPGSTLGLVAGVAILDTAGFVAFNLGVQKAATSVVATAAAPYAVPTIILGVLLLGERPKPPQWVGIGLVIGGLVLLGLSG